MPLSNGDQTETRNATVATLFVALMLLAPLGTLVVPSATAQVLDDPPQEDPPLGPAPMVEGDGFWNLVEGFATKTGYRMVFLWEADEPVAGTVRWGFAPDALDNIASPVGSLADTAQIAYMDVARSDVGKTVYFNVLDAISGSVSPTGSFHLGNAWRADTTDGVYEIDAVLQLDSKSLPDDVPLDSGLRELARGIDVFAERVWDMTDGYVRIGKVLVTDTAPQYPAYQPAGPGVCANTVDAGGMAVQHTLADFIVQTTIPFDSHTFGGGTPVIDDPCTGFYVGRIGQLIASPWVDDAHLGYVFAHEFGHYALGLDDLYETGTEPPGTAPGDCRTGTGTPPDNANGNWDVSLMHNSGGWTGSRWVLSELDRQQTPCVWGDKRVSWDVLTSWYPEIPLLGPNGDGLPDHTDSAHDQKRDNPDGGALDVYILNQLPGSSAVEHFIQAPQPEDEEETAPQVRIESPGSGSTVPATVLDVAGHVDRAAPQNLAPTAMLTGSPTSGEAPLDVTFTLGATDDDGTVVSWHLDFGDGAPAESGSGTPPTTRSHTYTADGTYTATLSIADDGGKQASAEETIIVGAGGGTRIGTDPSNDVPSQGACLGTVVECRHEWTAGATAGFDLLEASVEDRGESIRFAWRVTNASAFFVDPSGDPTGESHVVGYSLTTSFSTSPATSYSVNLDRARGDGNLTASVGKVFVALSLSSNLGAIGNVDHSTERFWVDIPKTQFPELAALSTLEGLQVTSSFTQQGTQVQLINTKDTLDVIENDAYTLESNLQPLGYGPSLLIDPQPAPTTVPADPELQDPTGDSFVGGSAVTHQDIEAAWFENDADYLYVGMKIADIPADPTTTTNFAYNVRFYPDWTQTGWGGATATNLIELRVKVNLDLSNAETSHRFVLESLYTTLSGNTFDELSTLPLSSIDADSDILWFVVPRALLQNPTAGATISKLSADTALSKNGAVVSGDVGAYGVWSDQALGPADRYSIGDPVTSLRALPGGPYSGTVGDPIPLDGDGSGGTAPYTCDWSSPDDATFLDPGSCATTVTFATVGDKTVILNVTDAANGTAEQAAFVEVVDTTAERVELRLSGDLLGSVPVDTSDGPTGWLKRVDLAGRSGSHTLTATWVDADGTELDTDSVDILIEDETPPAFVTVDAPGSLDTVQGVVTIEGRAGHGSGDSAGTSTPGSAEPTRTGAFGPEGLFQETAFVQMDGEILFQCPACHDVEQNGTAVFRGHPEGSLTYLAGDPGGDTDGLDGRWFDLSGLAGAAYRLEPVFDSVADIWFWNGVGDTTETGKDVGPDFAKTGIVPANTNWGFVYLRRTTETSLGALDAVTLTLTPPLSAPRDLTGSAGWNTTTLTWSAPEWDGGTDITGYEVLRDGHPVGATNATTTRFVDEGLASDATHAYTVRATNATTMGPETAPLSLTTGNDLTPPTLITGLAVTAVGTDTVSLAWDPSSDPETGVSQYRIQRNGALVGTTTGTTFTEGDLAEGTTYTYTVAAVNGQGAEGGGATTSATTNTTPVTETVSVYIDGVLLDGRTVDTTNGTADWSVDWDTRELEDGLHRITALFDDGRGATDTTEVWVEVDNVVARPMVEIHSPQNGTTTQPPFYFEGEFATQEGSIGTLGGSAVNADPITRDWLDSEWVRKTLLHPAYHTLLGKLETLDGYLTAYPSEQNGRAIVVLLEGTVAGSAPTSGLGVPIRYVTGIEPQTLSQTVDADVDALTLEEFEEWKASYTGPARPGIQEGLGPGSAMRMQTRTSTGALATSVCSTSYLFEDPYTSKYYLATAGHCLMDVGVTSSVANPEARARWVQVCVSGCVNNFAGVGTYVRLDPNATYHPVAFAHQAGIGADFGLVEIPESLWSHLRPHLSYWGGPTQFERPVPGDLIAQFGHGVAYGASFLTQGRLHVTLGGTKETGIRLAGLIAGGDSGSAFGTAFPRTDELLFGDGASGVITHAIGDPVLKTGLGVAWGMDLEDGLEMAGMQHLRLVTEDAEVRAPGEPADQPAGGPTFTGPQEGLTFDPDRQSIVRVNGTMTFDPDTKVGTATRSYFLHREGCGAGERLWMDTVQVSPSDNGCSNLLHPVAPVLDLLAANGVDLGAFASVWPAEPLPAETIWLDTSRKIHVGVDVFNAAGFEPIPAFDYEVRLSYDDTLVAEGRQTDLLFVDEQVSMRLTPLVASIPANANLTFTFVIHGGGTPVAVRNEGSEIRLPLADTPDLRVDVAVDDPHFAPENLLPVSGAESWSATWDLAGVGAGEHTLYARAYANGVPQGGTTTRTFHVSAGALQGPTAAFTKQATDLTVRFSDTSSAGDGALASWSWDFGDGATATDASPTHTYATDGTYTATLTVTDVNGLSDSSSLTFTLDDGVIEYVLEGRLLGPSGEAFGWTEIERAVEGENGFWSLLWDPDTLPEEGNYTFETRFLREGAPVANDSVWFLVDINRAPELDPIPDHDVEENSLLSFPVSATDADDDALTLTADGLPTNATFTDHGDGTGTFSWTPTTGDRGPYTVVVNASDGRLHDSEVVTIVVFEEALPPVLDPIPDQTVAEGTTLVVPMTASDRNGDLLGLTVTPLPPTAVVQKTGPDTWALKWTPGYRSHGEYTLTATVSDGAQTDATTFTVTVTDVDAPPSVTALDQTIIVGMSTSSQVNARDPDGDAVTLAASGLPTWATFTDLGSGLGRFTYDAPPAVTGSTWMITVSATSTNHTVSQTFKVWATGTMVIETTRVSPENLNGAPGTATPVTVRVANTGTAPGWVHLQGTVPEAGWAIGSPEDVYLPVGAAIQVTYTVTPGSTGSSSTATLKAIARDFANAADSTSVNVRIPVVLRVEMTQTSAVSGTEGVVRASYLNGLPAADVTIDLTDTSALGGPFVNTASGMTNATGAFGFRFDLNSPGGNMPGGHEVVVTGERYDRVDTGRAAYTVTV